MQAYLKMNPQQVGHKTKALLSKNGDVSPPVILILVIACLVLAISFLHTPEAAQLTPEQIHLLPLFATTASG